MAGILGEGYVSQAMVPAASGVPLPPLSGGRPGADSPGTCLRKGFEHLRDKVVTGVEGCQKDLSDLEDCLSRTRTQYQGLLMLLKELELGRIDLQATAQWLNNQRQNWKLRQNGCRRLRANPELDRRLADEEQFLAGEVTEADMQIAKVSVQVARLREVRDHLERRFMEQRRVVLRQGGVLETLNSQFVDPRAQTYHGAGAWPRKAASTTRGGPASQASGAFSKGKASVSPRPPQQPHSAR